MPIRTIRTTCRVRAPDLAPARDASGDGSSAGVGCALDDGADRRAARPHRRLELVTTIPLEGPMAIVDVNAASAAEIRAHRRTFHAFERLVLFAVMHVALTLGCLALAFL